MSQSRHDLRLLAHRGASARLPENTLPAFERALANGADVLELDVHRLKDGTPIVSHDPDGRRTGHTTRVLACMDLSELDEWDAGAAWVAPDGSRPFANTGLHPPVLETVLQTFPTARLNIDLKPRDDVLVQRAVEVVRREGATARVTFASFDARNMQLLRRLAPDVATALTASEASLLRFLPSAVTRARGVHGVTAQVPRHAGPFEIPTRRFIERAHALGLRVDVWLVNDPDEARLLLARGVDGLVTDDPARLAPVMNEFRDRRRTDAPAVL